MLGTFTFVLVTSASVSTWHGNTPEACNWMALNAPAVVAAQATPTRPIRFIRASCVPEVEPED